MNSIQCRIVSKPLIVKVAANPITTATTNSPVCENKSLVLNATGGSQYQWTGINNFSATGASVSVDNVQPQQSGKYYVQVTNDDGCKHLDSVIAVINPSPDAQTSFADVRICEGDHVKLGSSGGGSYQWIPATGLSSDIIADPIASPVTTIDYSVIVSNQFACKDTAKLLVNVIEAPRANAGTDKWIIKGTSAQLSATATGQNTSYSWMPAVFINDPQSLQPIVTPPRDTSYVLTVASNDGCGIATDTMHVFVYKDVFVPNAFSPNNDGLNDSWNIPALSAYPAFELTVFNRHGQIVFQNKNSNRSWNGQYKGEPLPEAVYVYVIDLKMGGEILKGTVMLLR
jgi:gliding motility-associated-like protein